MSTPPLTQFHAQVEVLSEIKLGPDDVVQLNRLYQVLKNDPDISYDYLQLFRLLDHPQQQTFVVRLQGSIVAMGSVVIMYKPDGGKAFIEDIATLPEAQRQGLADKVVRRLIEQAAKLGANKVMLTSNPSRTAAHALYERVGFQTHPTTVFQYHIAPSK